ncbi:MAG: glutamate--tRNA ligase [Candidatus Heimdallarchaeaceae archaeon]
MDKLIRKITLKNAIDFNGKAQAKSVIPKIIGEKPEVKKDIRNVIAKVNSIVDEINAMSYDEQVEELKKIAPELLEKKEKREKGLKELPNAKVGDFVTRLPPEPGKYLHIGHAIGFYINYLYSKKYNGQVILRFEDTNPQIPKIEFYEGIREDLKAIGIEYDKEIIESNNMEQYYKYGEQLITSGLAYACSCSQEVMREKRRQKEECTCRNRAIDETFSIWKKMKHDIKEGEYVIRLRGDMQSKDPLMRDPTIFRIIDKEHPLQGNKYRVWPSYDFAVAIEDGLNVTHVLRGAEFLQRTPLQNYIRKLLNIKNPEIIHYSRINVRGGLTAGRDIRALIKREKTSWDDPRLMTIRALLRRGIVPETFKHMAYDVGLSLAETNLDYIHIAGVNKKMIDPIAKRCFFVPDPVKIIVKNAPKLVAKIPIHPKKDMGTREIATEGVVWISRSDVQEGEVRLKDLYTINITKVDGEIEAEFVTEKYEKGVGIIQWVSNNHVKMQLIKPEGQQLHLIDGYGEIALKEYKKGEIIQMERIGYGRIDSKEPELTVIFAHK